MRTSRVSDQLREFRYEDEFVFGIAINLHGASH